MKNLILVVFMFIFFNGYSQYIAKEYDKVQAIPIYTMDGDTNINVQLTAPSMFTSAVQWYGLDQFDASIKVQYSMANPRKLSTTVPPDSTFIDYVLTPDSLLLNSTNGNSGIEDMDNGTAAAWLRWAIDSGTCTEGNTELRIEIISKR